MKLSPLTAFLVEDEPLCRADFRQTLKSFPEVKLLGEAENLSAARKFLERQTVDTLFLDVSLGRENGLDLVEKLSHRPQIIALTAHPQHAVRGFSMDLADYILKPVDEARLRTALNKVRHRRETAALQTGGITFVAEIRGKKILLPIADVLGVESMGNYVILHTKLGKAIKRVTFKQVRNKLPPSRFLETSRGRIVALHDVQSWHRNPEDRWALELTDKTTVEVSKSHAVAVMAALKARSDM